MAEDQEKKIRPATLFVDGLPCEACGHIVPRPGWIATDEKLLMGAGSWHRTCPACGHAQNLPAVFPNEAAAAFEIKRCDPNKRTLSPLNLDKLLSTGKFCIEDLGPCNPAPVLDEVSRKFSHPISRILRWPSKPIGILRPKVAPR